MVESLKAINRYMNRAALSILDDVDVVLFCSTEPRGLPMIKK